MSRNVSGKTRVCGVIGDPIEHSVSPVMHNAAFKELGLDYVYVPFLVKKEELEKAIAGMKSLNIKGLNVTIPHKVGVIPFLDNIDETANKIGAVNTIINDGGTLTGYNTDAPGFLRTLEGAGFEPQGAINTTCNPGSNRIRQDGLCKRIHVSNSKIGVVRSSGSV